LFCDSLNTKRKGFRRNKKGTIRRFLCFQCGKSFSFRNNNENDTTRRHLEDSSSYRTIQRRDGCSKNTAIKHIHKVGEVARDSFWIATNLKPKWSGILCFDGTYISVKNPLPKPVQKLFSKDERFLHKMVALLGVDYHTRDLPHYSLGENENMIDLVMHFRQLKENGYDINVLVRDGNKLISRAAEHVYGRVIPVQLCQRHFMTKFDDKIACRDLVGEQENIMKLKEKVWTIIRAPTIDLACEKMNEFMRLKTQFETSLTTKELVWKFIRDYEQLTMYLQYKKGLVPTTSNVAENMNKQLKSRLRSMCSFQTAKSAQDYLKLWCLKRRFQKFTDCKEPHKHLNGKAPLQLADCDISKLDYLKL